MRSTARFGNTSRRALKRCIHVGLLVGMTFLVFSNTLENGYHLDSIHRVAKNTEIDRFWPPSRFFTDVRTGSTVPQIAEYRPMMPLSHSVNIEIARAIGADRLAALHVGNIAIHAASVTLLYFLFTMLIAGWAVPSGTLARAVPAEDVAFGAALLVAVHPIAGSAVNYIAARDLLLMAFFLFASLFSYARMRRDGDSVLGWLSALLLLWLAILSKQSAIIAFGVVFLFEWMLLQGKLQDWRLWARTCGFALPTLAYFLLRWSWITHQTPGDSLRIPASLDFPLTMAKAHVFYYLRNFFWPFEMRALAKFDLVDSVADPTVLAGLALIAATLVAVWLVRGRYPLAAFAILAYWLLFSLEASIFPFRYVVTDYRQYLPFAFMALIVSLLIHSLRFRWLVTALLVGMVAYFSVATYLINRHWKSEESFWQQSVKYGAVALAHNNYGLEISRQDPRKAEQHFLEAVRQDANHIYANINLGMHYIRQGRPIEGLDLLQKTVELNPDWGLAHYWYAKGLEQLDRKEESTAQLRRAADVDPRHLQYQYAAARALQTYGDFPSSIPYLDRLMRFNHEYLDSGFLLGFAHQKMGETRRAIAEYERFLGHRPEHVQARFNLAYALMEEKQCRVAIGHFQTVLDLRPGYRESHLHLASCFDALGEVEAAAQHRRAYQTPD